MREARTEHVAAVRDSAVAYLTLDMALRRPREQRRPGDFVPWAFLDAFVDKDIEVPTKAEPLGRDDPKPKAFAPFVSARWYQVNGRGDAHQIILAVLGSQERLRDGQPSQRPRRP